MILIPDLKVSDKFIEGTEVYRETNINTVAIPVIVYILRVKKIKLDEIFTYFRTLPLNNEQ